MMKLQILYKWILVLVGGLVLSGCVDDELWEKAIVGDKEVWANLPFGCPSQEQVTITTRATYELQYESVVRNVYVFIFANNERVYGHYFDAEDKLSTQNAVQTATEEKWWVQNMTSSDGERTKGTIRMKVPVISNNAEVYVIANLDLNFLNISEERLNMVRNKQELAEVVVSLNQQIVERNAGLFMMVGHKTGVSIAENGTITVPGNKIELHRIDAKVELNVKIDPNGSVSNDGQVYKVKEFVPDSWQVINLPVNCSLIEGTVDPELEKREEGYFNLPARKFETFSEEKGDGFSFYMLENRENGKKSTNGNYHLRDKRLKNADGTYNMGNGLWEYAPEFATYVILKGTLNMLVNPNETGEQQLTADVTYHIHLGDFATSTDNYNIERNTHYTYTITIKGVNNIEAEVVTSNDDLAGIQEDQPGASGQLYKAGEEPFVFDAHYGQRVYTLKAAEINTSSLTWYVKTPFGREGSPEIDKVTGKPIYNGLDYKWVEFMLNKKQGGIYSDNNQWYPGTDSELLMDIVEFTNLIKEDVPKYKAGEESVFDTNGDLKVTVFVNEYYYESDPMNPDNQDPALWKKFVNKPNRLMHILCAAQYSKDGDSSLTGSAITIRQRAIETPYNINEADLVTAWGCETEDETVNNFLWFYGANDRYRGGVENQGNNSRLNGLYNTAALWGVVSGTNLVGGKRWDTYLEYERPNEYPVGATYPLYWMKEEYNAMLYAAMMRNRDNNGNGVIDPEEVRWYIASIEQLLGLFIGDMGLATDAQLYSMDKMVAGTYEAGHPFAGAQKFRDHVVSSTRSSYHNYPIMLWAEEGASTSGYLNDIEWGGSDPGAYSMRCVRNLGLTKEQQLLAIKTLEPEQDTKYIPERLISVSMSGSGSNAVYTFDLSNVNEGSLRSYYTTETLLPSDEYAPVSRPYKGFITGSKTTEYTEYDILKSKLEDLSFVPSVKGYRPPNVREGALMSIYCTDNKNWWGDNYVTLVSTYYSMGKHGSYLGIDPASNSKYTWYFGDNLATVNNSGGRPVSIRLVKDIEP